MRFLALAISLLLIQTTSTAQETRHRFCVAFGLGSSKLDTGIRDNTETIGEVLSYLDDATRRQDTEILKVVFAGSASPEGPEAVSRRLAEERSATAERYVRTRVLLPDSIVSSKFEPKGWRYLSSVISGNRTAFPDTLFGILNSGFSGQEIQRAVEKLDSGRVWNRLTSEVFPDMRNCEITIVASSATEKPETIRTLAPVELPDMTSAYAGSWSNETFQGGGITLCSKCL